MRRGGQVLPAAKAHDGEVESVEVVSEVEDFGEACACEPGFIPGACGELCLEEVMDAAEDGGMLWAIDGHEGHGSPGGLAWGGGALAAEGGVFVGIGGFAEGAVGFLVVEEPASGELDPLAVHGVADFSEAAEDLPGAVDVVDAPATEPGAIGFLGGADELDGFGDGGVIGEEAVVAEAFEGSACDIGAGGILDGVMVGEGDVFEELSVMGIAVEGGPSAVVILHGEYPLDAAFGGGEGVGAADASKGHSDHGGVIDIGVEAVVEFEVPAAGFDGVFDVGGPVAWLSAFFFEEPGGTALHGVVGGIEAGLCEGVGGDACVPDGGEAGLDADLVVLRVVDHEVIEVFVCLLDDGV